jgi:hypothetical protein
MPAWTLRRMLTMPTTAMEMESGWESESGLAVAGMRTPTR